MIAKPVRIPEIQDKNISFEKAKGRLCKINIDNDTYYLLMELLERISTDEVLQKLCIHKGTLKRWLTLKDVPNNYYNDINHLLGDKYKNKDTYREKDQFYTSKEISNYCYKKTLEILKQLDIDFNEYIFIEPSAGCCNFYDILPQKNE
jgi:hypothetical protein